jgi:hypothetical protein
MSDESDLGFAPPPFSADSALQQMKRTLRDCRLAERGNAFELRGKRVVELAVNDGAIDVRIARRLMLTPEFDRQRVASANDQRKAIDEIKKRLARWERGDE